MKTKLLGFLSVVLFAVPVIAAADQVYDFTYTDANATVTGTLDVSGGQALSGSGTITSTAYLGGSEPITLVTLSTPGVNNLGGGNLSYRFGGGTDLIGDTVFNSSDPWVDTQGLVFLIGGPGDNGFNIWANSTSPGGSYTGFVAGNSNYGSANGTFTATPVPLPAGVWLLLSGLAGMGLVSRRRIVAGITA
jgi:hypothetical protein